MSNNAYNAVQFATQVVKPPENPNFVGSCAYFIANSSEVDPLKISEVTLDATDPTKLAAPAETYREFCPTLKDALALGLSGKAKVAVETFFANTTSGGISIYYLGAPKSTLPPQIKLMELVLKEIPSFAVHFESSLFIDSKVPATPVFDPTAIALMKEWSSPAKYLETFPSYSTVNFFLNWTGVDATKIPANMPMVSNLLMNAQIVLETKENLSMAIMGMVREVDLSSNVSYLRSFHFGYLKNISVYDLPKGLPLAEIDKHFFNRAASAAAGGLPKDVMLIGGMSTNESMLKNLYAKNFTVNALSFEGNSFLYRLENSGLGSPDFTQSNLDDLEDSWNSLLQNYKTRGIIANYNIDTTSVEEYFVQNSITTERINYQGFRIVIQTSTVLEKIGGDIVFVFNPQDFKFFIGG